MSSLMKLKMYSDSDSDNDSDCNCDKERNHELRLPLPNFLQKSSDAKSSSQEVNEDGKIRNFPHEPGNWATYIFIPVDSFEFSDYLSSLPKFFMPLDMKLVEDFHISLTKTVILRHHWIPDFINSVKNNLKEISSFQIRLCGLKCYVNENNTRSFLSLKVDEGEEYLTTIVSQLSDSFRDYNLEGFYEDPSFHVSILWCPGNKQNEINKQINSLPFKLKTFDLHIKVSHCICATGNKLFTFNLYQIGTKDSRPDSEKKSFKHI